MQDYLLNQETLIDSFYALLTSVKIDIDYSYDEKFALWIIKNNFFGYLK